MTRPGLIGQTLGNRYTVQELLGQGGMSAVYKAYDPNLQRAVAIKVIHNHLSADPKFLTRFESEATAVAQLRHPNIVQVYDFSHDDDLYYMVQEFVAGETLQERLRRLNKAGREMPVQDAIRYAIDVAAAAGYAHGRGMIHRDIKPANIMLTVHDDAILMDFGIVKIAGGTQHTVTGAVVGTALYMPPELIRGEVPDPRSDIYSLGVTLFEMVSGRPPFEADSAMALMMMHLRDPVPDVHSLRPGVPAPLVAVIEKMLAKERDARYASMVELAGELNTILDHVKTGAPLRLRATDVGGTAGGPTVLDSPTYGGDATATNHRPPAWQSASQRPPFPAPAPPPPGATVIESRAGQAGRNGDPGTRPDASMAPGSSRVGASSPAWAAVAPPRDVAPGRRRALPIALIAGAVVLLAVLGGVLALVLGNNGDKGEPTQVAGQSATGAPALVTQVVTNTPGVVATPEATAMAGHGASTTPAPPPPPMRATITNITLDPAQGRYVAEYTLEGLDLQPAGSHVQFFFNTLPTDLVGSASITGWVPYTGASPFAGLAPADRPSNAAALCIQGARPDETPILSSGNCKVLPDLTTAVTLKEDEPCRYGPGEDFAAVEQLRAGDSSIALGLSNDEMWFNVAHLRAPNVTCWLPLAKTDVPPGVADLPFVEGPPPGSMPTVQITGITIGQDGHYVVEHVDTGFAPAYPGGTHIHFFFNNFSETDVGIGGNANRKSHGETAPFTGYATADRPPTAGRLCAVVANPDHSVIFGSGNCFPLPDAPKLEITGITLDDQMHYVVAFNVAGFEPAYPGTHIHFFFNTFSEHDVGIGGEANRRSYGGASPFTGLTAADRPFKAAQLCGVVANPNHTVILGSGNCMVLPDVVPTSP